MATESPIRMSETSGKWPSLKEAAAFAPSSANMAAEELGLLLKGHRFHGSGKDLVPNRSGSAPPSMEGSFLAIDNLISQQNSSMDASLASLNSALQNCESEEQLRADPAYLAYYCSNVNLNPRLPPPLISWENRRLVRHIGSFGNVRGSNSLDDSSKGFLQFSQGALSTHKEESEDDQSPKQTCEYQVDGRSEFWSGQDAGAFGGDNKSLANLIKEDGIHSSPVRNQSHSSIHGMNDEPVDKLWSMHGPVGKENAVMSSLVTGDIGIPSNINISVAPVPNSSSLDCTGSTTAKPMLHKENSNSTHIDSSYEDLISGVNNVAIIESEMSALNISSPSNLENQKNQEQWQHSSQNNMLQHHLQQQQNNSFQVQVAKSQMISQGVKCTYIGTDQFPQVPCKFSAEVQPVLQSSGFNPPLYATATAYMNPANPFYPNMQASGLFSPQYGVGSYPLTPTVVPPYVTGCPPHGAMPLVFDGNARTSNVFDGGTVPHGSDMQHLNKFYGQLGFSLQPSFADPLYMQYYQQPFGEAYATSGQVDPLVSRGGVIGSQIGVLDSQRGSDTAACLDDQKFQYQRHGAPSNLNPRRGGTVSPNYFGAPPNMGIFMQYPTSPLASPVLPGSPVGVTGHPSGRNEMRFSPSSGRNAGGYSGWQGQRGFESFDDLKVFNFLEELKSGKGRRFELSDITGHIVEFSADQHGSRFIQQKLENCTVEEKASVFKEVLPHASKLMTDVFGNYVIQKFFEYGSPDQRKELANQLTGQILPLSLQMYGCRVIQKALEVIELEQKAQLILELDGHVIRCVRDQNGNHVIQKCIESVPTEKVGFIISSFRGQVASLSMHPYGCRVIQRVLEHCTDELQCQFIVDEILESVCALAQDQYGNYVTQHVLERGKPHERSQIISKLSGHVVQLSQHKFASNVVEKCLEFGGTPEREVMIAEIVGHNDGNDNLLTMMKDQFANYVVQKILEICTDNQRVQLLSRVRLHVHALKKYTYGKHIVTRFEQLLGEENETLES